MFYLLDAVSELQNAGEISIAVLREATDWAKQLSGAWFAMLAMLLISIKAIK